MNPLGMGGFSQSTLPPQMMNGINQVKNIMKMANGNPMTMLQQMNNPAANQIMQMLKTQNPQQVFTAMAKQAGIDPQAVINELRK